MPPLHDTLARYFIRVYSLVNVMTKSMHRWLSVKFGEHVHGIYWYGPDMDRRTELITLWKVNYMVIVGASVAVAEAQFDRQ